MSSLFKDSFQAVWSTRDGLFINRVENSTTRSHGVSFSPAEADSLERMLTTVLRVESVPVLPRKLQVTPFECEFSANKSIELRRKGQKHGTGLQWTFDEGDGLIWIVQHAKVGIVAETGKQPQGPSRPYWPMPEPPISGR